MINNILKYLNNYLVLIPSILIFILMITLPTIYLPRDMWDGLSIAYANDTNNYEGIFIYFLESNWLFQYPLSIVIIKLSHLFSMDYKNMNSIFVLITFIFILNESRIFSIIFLDFNKIQIIALTCLISSFPIWGVLLSSIMTFHLFCIFVGLFSIRLIHSNKLFYEILGYILIIISFNFQSLLLFLPFLSFIYDKIYDSNSIKNQFKYLSYKTILVLFIAIMIYFILNFIHPPYGIYNNYNQVSIFSIKGLFGFIYSILSYITFFLPLFICLGVTSLILLLFPGSFTFNINNDKINLKLFLLFSLCVVSILPYVIVGKNTNIFDVLYWNIRQAFPLAFPLSLLIVYSLKLFKNNNKINLFVSQIICLIFINLIIMSYGIIKKLNREIFLSKLKNELILKKNSIPNGGLLEIISPNFPEPLAAFYELNYLMYKTTNQANMWCKFDTQVDNKFYVPQNIINNKRYQKEYIFDYNPINFTKHTIIDIKIENFNGFKNQIRNILNPNNCKVDITAIKVYKI